MRLSAVRRVSVGCWQEETRAARARSGEIKERLKQIQQQQSQQQSPQQEPNEDYKELWDQVRQRGAGLW